ncbi:predicted protein [Aspergillus terreus NIH2624]|uniref:Uncharacterized protein n=1 Tax=Aspergillus terreus (strain NIH 2624 / FGSC A1156) TaxID=341663 RepID=Q0CZT7_ASPTN|nr:uncharacterized protein ATEG_00797 [Aspergillus terreus NIH2624]EAU39443.1 predicted protein [Aspergillus terreus NIH2624]
MIFLSGAAEINHIIRSRSDSSEDKTYHLSGGAITGVVVVSFAAVTIVLLWIFRKQLVICCSRRKQPVADEEQTLPSPTYAPSQRQSALQDAPYRDGSAWQAFEMSSEQNAIHEIGQPDPHELGSLDVKPKGHGRVIHELN